MTEAARNRPDIGDEFAAARSRQAEGHLNEAKAAYGEILARVPNHPESLTMLSSIAYQQGDDVQAEAYIDRAIAVYKAVVQQMPQMTKARGPLVNLLLARGRVQEAEDYVADLELTINPVRSTIADFTRRRRIGKAQGLPAMLMNTLPKSASESIWNKLAEGLTLGQGHISVGLFPDCCVVPIRVMAACEGGFIAKEHLPATPFNIKCLADGGLTRMVCHVRDPRQATLSWAHFVRDDVSMRLIAPIWRKTVPPRSVDKADFAGYIDWCIEHYLPLLIEFQQGWIAVEQDPEQPIDVLMLTFEEFLAGPEDYCGRVLDHYGIDRTLFRAGAEAEVVHLRKGQAEEWRDVFNAGQRERAWELIPRELAERFGWSK